MKKVLCVILAIVLTLSLESCGAGNTAGNGSGGKNDPQPDKRASAFISDLIMSGNGLSDFDLKFLKLENDRVNKVYSPLSVKYALQMLSEGAAGDTKYQLDGVIGKYASNKYVNSANMSFANAMFIKDSFKDSVRADYKDKLSSKYGADIVFDAFATSDTINKWVSDRTFALIPQLMNDVSDLDYVLVNALAIDMEWNNKIQSETSYYKADIRNEKYTFGSGPYDYSTGPWVSSLMGSGYHRLDFSGAAQQVKSVEIAAAANKYDIISALGEDNIRKTVLDEYAKYKASGGWEYEPFNIETYMEDIKSNYGKISSSTDFMFYDDEAVKVFAKDLKTYDGLTLQYVGIMPKTADLADYVGKVTAADLNKLTGSLKEIKSECFEEGYLTVVEGYIPMFSYDYELHLKDDLQAIGITDVFDADKADLSGLSSGKTYIGSAVHKANIEFSNDGIKASAATALGGLGDAGPGFEYWFDVPVKIIDLTFDRPYMYLIRDKNTGEVWFTGTVYQPEVDTTRYW